MRRCNIDVKCIMYLLYTIKSLIFLTYVGEFPPGPVNVLLNKNIIIMVYFCINFQFRLENHFERSFNVIHIHEKKKLR